MSFDEDFGDDGAGGSAAPAESRTSSEDREQNDSSQSSTQQMSPSKDFHLVGKSSSRFGEKRTNLCNAHQNGLRCRRSTTSVACQTDQTEEYSVIVPSSVTSSKVTTPEPATTSTASDGVLRLMIQNFRNMTDTVRGPNKRIQGVNWRIMVMPRQHVVQKKGTQKCLGFFLQCCPEAYSDAWSCQASAELRLISQRAGIPHFTRKTNHGYTAKENDWGYSCFMTWADILDESQGYIKDDRVILEVSVKAEPPKNILTHEEFQKSIQNWYDLADMQFKRGCIDLAIEANAQALKFCKDRDTECKTKLEDQKLFFIEQKLVLSIQRIEKGKDPSKNDDDVSSSQTALKMALTASSGQKSSQNSKRDKAAKKEQRKQRPVTPPGQPLKNAQVGKEVKMEQAATVKNTSSDISGQFNKIFLGDIPLCQSWVKRSKNDDDLYTKLVRQLDESFVETCENQKDRDNFVMKYISGELKSLNLEDTQSKKNWATIQQLRNFAENAFDVELQRQVIIKNAIEDAKSVQDRVTAFEAEKAKELEEEKELPDEEKDFPCLGMLWEEGRQEARQNIVDKEDRFLDAKIRLFWNDDDSNCWMEDELSFSDRESISSDSDRQNDGSIKAKRSKRDHELECDSCIKERLDHLTLCVNMCDSGCQTEAIISSKSADPVVPLTETKTAQTPPAFNQRIVKKATSTKAKKGVLKAQSPKKEEVKIMPSPESPASPDPVADEELAVAESLGEFGSQKRAVPRVLPMEYAMKFYEEQAEAVTEEVDKEVVVPDSKGIEEWLRQNMTTCWKTLRPGDKRPATPPVGVPVNIEITGNFNDQVLHPNPSNHVMTALSVMAMNLMNTKRIVTKVDEILQTIASQASSDVIRSVLRDLSKLAGTNYVENEGKFLMPDTTITEDLSDEDLNALYLKFISKTSEGDFILLDQISRLDACKAELSHYYFLDAEDSEKIVQGTALIENKLTASTKQVKELQKHVDDWESKVKKIEKQFKDENKNIKQQLTAEKEKTTSLTKEIKEKNKENKKLETKVNNLSTEKDEYHEKVKQLQKELQTLQKKSSEEQQKAKREIQQLSEAKKHLQAELNNRDVELRGQALQVEEKNSIIKKLREDINQERHKTTSASQAVHSAIERAKQSEIVLLQHQLDVGLSLLERAKEDASKNVKEMDDAANNSRARSSTIYRDDVAMYIQSRNEWNSIIDELKILIAKAKTEFGQHMDAIRAGKPLASLPKISVAKPPPPAQILKVAPIAPVEPTKPLPGVIGSRPQPAPIGSNISPKSRAPGSPIQKPLPPQGSPVRHPAPIGTRPNNGNDSNTNNGTSVPTMNDWPWSNSLSAITESLHANKRTFGPLTGEFGNMSDVHSATPSIVRPEQNGWEDHNNWNTQSNNGHQTTNSYNPMVSTHSQVYGQQTNWMPQDQLQRQQQQFVMSMRQSAAANPHVHHLLERVTKKICVDHEKALELVFEYCNKHQVNVYTISGDELAEKIREYCQRKYVPRLAAPPGSAPGYAMQNLGLDRPAPYLMENHILNGDVRPVPTDKWSNGI